MENSAQLEINWQNRVNLITSPEFSLRNRRLIRQVMDLSYNLKPNGKAGK
jgi:hypothetical protein